MKGSSGVRRAVVALLALGAVALTTFFFTSDWPLRYFGPATANPFHGTDISRENWGGPFSLSDGSGQVRSLSDFRGKVVLLTFGYTHCPDVCPTTLEKFAQVLRLLGNDAARVQVLFVTVDPQRDSAELLHHYVPSFDPSFIGLRGTQAQTDAVVASYHATYQIIRRGNEVEVDHTASTYIIDPHGRTRVLASYEQPARELADDVVHLLHSG